MASQHRKKAMPHSLSGVAKRREHQRKRSERHKRKKRLQEEDKKRGRQTRNARARKQ